MARYAIVKYVDSTAGCWGSVVEKDGARVFGPAGHDGCELWIESHIHTGHITATDTVDWSGAVERTVSAYSLPYQNWRDDTPA